MGAPTPRGRGRPVIGPEVRGLRLGAVTLAELMHLAAAIGRTRGEVIRAMVEWVLADDRAREAITAQLARPR